MTKCSKLYRELSKQGYFKKTGKEPKVDFRLTTKGLRAVYLLGTQMQKQGIEWSEAQKAGLLESFTHESKKQTSMNMIKTIRMTAESLEEFHKE